MYLYFVKFNEQTVAKFQNNGLLTYEEGDRGVTNGLFLKDRIKARIILNNL